MISRTNIVLSGLLVAVVILTAASRVDPARPNIEILPDMKYTPAWTAFSPNPNFRNGRTLQAPVPGTIARGDSPLYYEATKEDAERAGEELPNPYRVETDGLGASPRGLISETSTADEADSAAQQEDESEANAETALRESVQRGADVYRVFCISCHGPAGAGDGPVTQRGFPPPPSLLTGNSRQMKDGQLFHILTYGQVSMSSFAGQLSHQQRWDVINYVRDLQEKAGPSTLQNASASTASETTGPPEIPEATTSETATLSDPDGESENAETPLSEEGDIDVP